MSRIRSQSVTGWPWSKVKTEQQRLAERPSVRRGDSKIKELNKEILRLGMLEVQIDDALTRVSDNQIRRQYLEQIKELRRKRLPLEDEREALIDEIDNMEKMTYRDVYGPPPASAEPARESDYSSSDDVSASSPGGAMAKSRSRTSKPLPRRNLRTGRFISQRKY